MTEPTQEQLRTEAYWRSTIARELYARADEMEGGALDRVAGVALASIVRDAGNKVGQMPDRMLPEPDVTTVWDDDGDEWIRRADGWREAADAPDSPYVRTWAFLWDRYGPITTTRPGGA